jgi:hypothetical protein
MSVAYTLYINEPASRFLDEKVDAEETEWRRLEDLHKIDAVVQSLVEDLGQLLPDGYTLETVKELP